MGGWAFFSRSVFAVHEHNVSAAIYLGYRNLHEIAYWPHGEIIGPPHDFITGGNSNHLKSHLANKPVMKKSLGSYAIMWNPMRMRTVLCAPWPV